MTPCTISPCLFNGTCSISGSSYDCSCQDGFRGTHCEGLWKHWILETLQEAMIILSLTRWLDRNKLWRFVETLHIRDIAKSKDKLQLVNGGQYLVKVEVITSLHLKQLIKSLSCVFDAIQLLKCNQRTLQCCVNYKFQRIVIKKHKFCFVLHCFACGSNTFSETFP